MNLSIRVSTKWVKNVWKLWYTHPLNLSMKGLSQIFSFNLEFYHRQKDFSNTWQISKIVNDIFAPILSTSTTNVLSDWLHMIYRHIDIYKHILKHFAQITKKKYLCNKERLYYEEIPSISILRYPGTSLWLTLHTVLFLQLFHSSTCWGDERERERERVREKEEGEERKRERMKGKEISQVHILRYSCQGTVWRVCVSVSLGKQEIEKEWAKSLDGWNEEFLNQKILSCPWCDCLLFYCQCYATHHPIIPPSSHHLLSLSLSLSRTWIVTCSSSPSLWYIRSIFSTSYNYPGALWRRFVPSQRSSRMSIDCHTKV